MKAMNQLLFRTLSARTGRLSEAIRTPPDPVRLLMLLSLAGTAGGVLLCARLPQLADMPFLMQGLRASAAERTLWDVFTGVLRPVLAMLCGILLSGTAAFGQPLLLTLLLFRGMSAGLALADCFAQYPFRQAFYAAALCILPFAYLTQVLLIHAVREAFSLSGTAARYLLRGQAQEEIAGKLHGFLFRMLTAALLMLLAAGMHTVLLWLINDRFLCAGL